MDTFLVYLIFVAEGVKNALLGGWRDFASFAGIILLIIGFVQTIVKLVNESDNDWGEKDEKNYNRFCPKFKKLGFIFIALSFFMGLIASTIPTAKQSAVIYIVPKIINNQNMNQIPDNLAKLVNEGLKELTSMVKEEGEELTEELKKEAQEIISKKGEE
jgi:hypothetical protein